MSNHGDHGQIYKQKHNGNNLRIKHLKNQSCLNIDFSLLSTLL